MGVYDIFSCACGAGGGRIPLTCLRHNEELRLGLDAATQQGACVIDRGKRYKGHSRSRGLSNKKLYSKASEKSFFFQQQQAGN